MSPLATQVPREFRGLLIGASGSGKTRFVGKLLQNKADIFPVTYKKFLYCSPHIGGGTISSARDVEYREKLEEWAAPTEISFHNYIPSEEEVLDVSDSVDGPILLIIDDYSLELFQTDLVYQLFTRMSTHKMVNSLVSLHVGCASKTSGKWYQAVTQNCNYLVLFRNIANRASTGELSKRIFPYADNFLQRCLTKATEYLGSYGYICVDASLTNQLNNRFGVRTNIF